MRNSAQPAETYIAETRKRLPILVSHTRASLELCLLSEASTDSAPATVQPFLGSLPPTATLRQIFEACPASSQIRISDVEARVSMVITRAGGMQKVSFETIDSRHPDLRFVSERSSRIVWNEERLRQFALALQLFLSQLEYHRAFQWEIVL